MDFLPNSVKWATQRVALAQRPNLYQIHASEFCWFVSHDCKSKERKKENKITFLTSVRMTERHKAKQYIYIHIFTISLISFAKAIYQVIHNENMTTEGQRRFSL